MTGIERAIRTLNFQPTDRVPIYSHLRHPAVIAKLTGTNFWENPRKATARAYQILEIDMVKDIHVPYTGSQPAGYRINPTGYGLYKEKPDLATMEDVVEFARRLPSEEQQRREFDFDRELGEYRRTRTRLQEEVGDSTLLTGAIGGTFTDNIDLMGYENLLMGMVTEREALQDIMRWQAVRNRLRAEVIAEASMVPATMVCDDIAGGNGLLVSPQMCRQMILPNLAFIMEPLRRRGIKVIFHSDGNLNQILDDLVEIGIDGLHPIEPKAGMDLAEVKRRYGGESADLAQGKRLVLLGNVCVATTLPFGTPDDVEREVKWCMDVASPGGGYFLACSSMIGPEIPVENALAMYEAARRYGQQKV